MKNALGGKIAGSSFSADFSEFELKRQAWYKPKAPETREMEAMKRIP